MGFGNRLWHHLFDQPISRRELDTVLRLLRVALAETDTDAGFERLLRQMVRRDTGLGTEHAWLYVRGHLESYRRPLEGDAGPRTLARRFVADPPLPLDRGRASPPGDGGGRGPGLVRLAMIYVLALIVLCAIGRVCLDRAFPAGPGLTTAR